MGDIPWFLNVENHKNFETMWKDKKFSQESEVIIGDFERMLLERIIHHRGWKKVICTPQATYPTLVKEFFAIYYADIDNLESSRKNQTWVREKWIRFTLAIIDRYYGFYHTYVDPLLPEQNLALVAHFLYDR